MIKVLSIAGSDPSGGAGIQADLKVFQTLGAFGMAVPAALTVQNSEGVRSVHPISPRVFAGQLATLISDIRPHALKTGMLLSSSVVRTTAREVIRQGLKNLVLDPVIASSSGHALMKPDALRILKKELLPHALLVTPNLPETEVLSGMTIQSQADIDYAAGRIMDMGPRYVLIKGGHRIGPAEDTLYGGKSVLSFSTRRRKGEFHGTGCVLSAAITVFIASGLPVEKAMEKAKQFVDRMLNHARPVGKGRTRYFLFK